MWRLLNFWQADLHTLFVDKALSTAIYGARMCSHAHTRILLQGKGESGASHALLQGNGEERRASSDKTYFAMNSPFPSKAMQWKLFPRIRVHWGGGGEREKNGRRGC